MISQFSLEKEGRLLFKWVNKQKETNRVSLRELWEGQGHDHHTVTDHDDWATVTRSR